MVHLLAGNLQAGAARGAYLLHKGLLDLGVDSALITNVSDEYHDKDVVSLSGTKIRKVLAALAIHLDTLLLLLYPKRNKNIFSTGIFGLNYKSHQALQNADVVHLHWVNGLVTIRSLKRLKKPIVWTIRDMWPITGGCHYSLECGKYIDGCGSCPQLGSSIKYDLSYLGARAKKGVSRRVTPVGISAWLSGAAEKSSIFEGRKVETIDNGIDCDVFFPVTKEVAKGVLEVKTTKKVILVGATSIHDFYKGFALLREALRCLDKDDYYLLVFGQADVAAISEIGMDFQLLGYLNDDVTLRLAYSAADVFVAPSVQEAFGKTLAESMACGTPVVCFDATGPAGIVEHKKNGYKAKPFESEDLALGIRWVLDNSDRKELSKSARERTLSNFDYRLAAKRYYSLYRRLVDAEAA